MGTQSTARASGHVGNESAYRRRAAGFASSRTSGVITPVISPAATRHCFGSLIRATNGCRARVYRGEGSDDLELVRRQSDLPFGLAQRRIQRRRIDGLELASRESELAAVDTVFATHDQDEP